MQDNIQYSQLISRINTGIIVYSVKKQVLFYNPAALDILGLTSGQLTGKGKRDPEWKMIKEDRSPLPQNEQPEEIILHTNQMLNDYIIGILKPGIETITWILINGFPEFSANGCLMRITLSFNNITRQKHAEEELKTDDFRHEALYRLDKTPQLNLDELLEQLTKECQRLTYSNSGCFYAAKNKVGLDSPIFFYPDFKNCPKMKGQNEIIKAKNTYLNECIEKGKPIFNNHCDITMSKNIKNGELLTVHRYLNFPVINEGAIIGVINVYNKIEPYTNKDIQRLSLFINNALYIINRRKVENELEKLSLAVKESPVAIVITDKKGVIEYVNPKFSALTGYTFDEALGKNPSVLKSGVQDKGFYKKLWDTILSGKEWKGEFCNVKKNGELFWESASISPMRDKNGKITNFVAVKLDITENKKISKQLKIAKVKAEEANKAKSTFLANMSHEIRTPMNAVLGFAELLSYEISDPQLKSYISSIKLSGQSLLKLINDILDLSKIEANKIELNFDYINLRLLLQDIHYIFSYQLSKKNVKFIIDIPKSFPKVIYIDDLRFRQILMNLISNAIKFTERGYIKIHISHLEKPQLRPKPGVNDNNTYIDLKISVEDTGIGIAPGYYETIFNSFIQGESQSTKKYGGTGLGLSICKKLVKLMEGKITVESVPGKGSKFEICIPDVLISNELSQYDYEPEIDLDSFDFLQSTVLIVDDKENNRKYLSKALSLKNIKVVESNDGKDALAKLETSKPDMIITDIIMPNMDGFDFIKAIKTSKHFKDVPIIISSASALKSTRDKISKMGIQGFLIKPFRINDLYTFLIQYLPYCSKKPHSLKSNIETDKKEYLSTYKKNIPVYTIENLKEQLQKLKDRNSITESEQFCEKLKKIGESYRIQYFKKYAQKMKVAIASFDIERMKNIFEEFTIDE